MIVEDYINKIQFPSNIDYNYFENKDFFKNYNSYLNVKPKKFSILQYNFNNYEKFYEPEVVDPDVEYIYVTDNKLLKSDKWTIVYDDSLNDLSVFEKCYMVRFNLFKYCTTDVCIYLDADIHIYDSIKWLYYEFINSNTDIGLNIHPTRNDLISEYVTWVNVRNYPKKQFYRIIKYLLLHDFNIDMKGIIQGTMRICKNTKLNQELDDKVFNLLKELSIDGVIERLDQTIYTAVLNKYFNNISVFPFNDSVFFNKTLFKYGHNVFHNKIPGKIMEFWNNNEHYLFDKKITMTNYNI